MYKQIEQSEKELSQIHTYVENKSKSIGKIARQLEEVVLKTDEDVSEKEYEEWVRLSNESALAREEAQKHKFEIVILMDGIFDQDKVVSNISHLINSSNTVLVSPSLEVESALHSMKKRGLLPKAILKSYPSDLSSYLICCSKFHVDLAYFKRLNCILFLV